MSTDLSRRSLLLGTLGAGVTASAVSGLGSPASAARKPVIYVAGDSTAALSPQKLHPQAGWGQALPVFLSGAFTVEDRAKAGASSKSYIEVENRLAPIAAAIRPGDFLLISFGHNDAKSDEPRHTDPATTFPEYLTRYVDVARKAGARPVLVTPVERRRFDAAGKPYTSHGDYPQAMRDLGARIKVPVVDLTAESLALWGRLGPEGTKKCFLWLDAGASPNWPNGATDNTHFQAHGAIELARIVVGGLVAERLIRRDAVRRLRDENIPDSAVGWPATV